MPILDPFRRRLWLSPPLLLLLMLLATLWLAGGASRADASGQVIVRAVSWALLIVSVLATERAYPRRSDPVLLLLLGAILLALLQLVPLAPDVWQALPGRGLFETAAAASGQNQPWRPWSIVPSATANAASSLIVPITTYVLMRGLKEHERPWLPGILLGFVVASMLVGLMQFSGTGFNNPFINDINGQVSGMFANRNHFALFLGFGCLLTPIWVFIEGHRAGWRGPVAIALLLLLMLMILATGSRVGLLLGFAAIAIGLVLARRDISREFRAYPRWAAPALITGIVGMILIFVLISIAANRAVSIDRLLTADPWQDMRTRGLPTVIEMIRIYFPMGAGLGSFDPIFRIHEPFALLTPTYFNHAHNDLLEIVLDAGLPGLLLLLAGLFWWISASVRAWRGDGRIRDALPRVGSAMLLLTVLASAFDYPARTPMIMAVAVIAGMWLSDGVERRRTSALPKSGPDL